ncbi:facilitated trehalose transporter Tret1-2 homolog isoform X1 [Bacillus rossius redtenbacheri]|uniref:facilitated trehalose transporter Tret1-2 homolog isoform X1 n=1 Tax=Bacillus rossius redtenbacheri TaxID=93214 RepID=UPI002FDCF922
MKQDNQKILRHNARDLQNHILSPSVVSEEDTPLLAGIRGSGRGAKDYVIGADDVPIPTTKSRQYVAALSATLGPFALGTVLAWTAPNGTKLVRSDLNPGPGLLTEEQWTWIGSLVNVGAGIAVLAVGYLVDAVGRKRTMLGLVAPFTAGWLLIAWADQAVPLYYVGRLLTGMAGGAFTLTVPIYISEIAESDIRGVLGTYFQLMFTCGILFVYVLGAVPAVSVFALNMACAAVPVLFGLIFVFMPESPVYYVKKGCGNKARRSLRWLRGKHYDPEPELQEIQDVVDLIASEKLSFSEAFKTRAARKALGVCLGLMFFQQLSGVNTVIFYVSFIFKSSVEMTCGVVVMAAVGWQRGAAGDSHGGGGCDPGAQHGRCHAAGGPRRPQTAAVRVRPEHGSVHAGAGPVLPPGGAVGRTGLAARRRRVRLRGHLQPGLRLRALAHGRRAVPPAHQGRRRVPRLPRQLAALLPRHQVLLPPAAAVRLGRHLLAVRRRVAAGHGLRGAVRAGDPGQVPGGHPARAGGRARPRHGARQPAAQASTLVSCADVNLQ